MPQSLIKFCFVIWLFASSAAWSFDPAKVAANPNAPLLTIASVANPTHGTVGFESLGASPIGLGGLPLGQ